MGTDMSRTPWIVVLGCLTTLAVGENFGASYDYPDIPTDKRSLFDSLPGMTGLSLMNPWHAARTLLNPEVPEVLRYDPIAETRHQRSVIDELNPLGPKFFKAKLRATGPMFKRDVDE